jgi:hypothetical protein
MRNVARLTAKQRALGRAALQAKAHARASDLVLTIKELQAAGRESLRAMQRALRSAALQQLEGASGPPFR